MYTESPVNNGPTRLRSINRWSKTRCYITIFFLYILQNYITRISYKNALRLCVLLIFPITNLE